MQLELIVVIVLLVIVILLFLFRKPGTQPDPMLHARFDQLLNSLRQDFLTNRTETAGHARDTRSEINDTLRNFKQE